MHSNSILWSMHLLKWQKPPPPPHLCYHACASSFLSKYHVVFGCSLFLFGLENKSSSIRTSPHVVLTKNDAQIKASCSINRVNWCLSELWTTACWFTFLRRSVFLFSNVIILLSRSANLFSKNWNHCSIMCLQQLMFATSFWTLKQPLNI